MKKKGQRSELKDAFFMLFGVIFFVGMGIILVFKGVLPMEQPKVEAHYYPIVESDLGRHPNGYMYTMVLIEKNGQFEEVETTAVPKDGNVKQLVGSCIYGTFAEPGTPQNIKITDCPEK